MKTYPVKVGETIGDVVLNSTGNFANWDTICRANGFDSWTPDLVAGQLVVIPDDAVIDENTLRGLQARPICNNGSTRIFDKIDAIVSLLTGNWILKTGVWNDKGVWIDTAQWID